MPARIGKDEFETEVLKSPIPVLADFYSDSCIPCKRMAPILSQLETEYENKLKVVKINTNFEKELVEKYGIMAAPTFVFFKNGEETARIRGAVKKDELISHIDSLI